MAASTTYLNFDLAVERDGSSGEPSYRVRLIENQRWGQPPPHRVPRLPDAAALKLFANEIKRHRLLAALPTTPATVEFAQPLGMELLEALLQGEIKAAYQFALREAEQHAGLRVRLHLDHAAPELQNLPWEYICTPPPNPRFLTTKTKWHLLRFLGQPQPHSPIKPVSLLRVLVIVGADMPADHHNPRRPQWLAAVNELRDTLRDAAYPIELHIPEPCELGDLNRFISHHGPFHALHYLGHGKFDDDIEEGCLYFSTGTGMCRVTADQLYVLLDGQDQLQLITLCACLGTRSGLNNPFSSMAAGLTLTNVAAVVSMLLEIEQRTAIMFARNFYAYLAEGSPVDEAVAQARRALYLHKRNAEFGLPALYTRQGEPIRLLKKQGKRAAIQLPAINDDAPSATLAAEVDATVLEFELQLLDRRRPSEQLQQIRDDVIQLKAVQQHLMSVAPPLKAAPAVQQGAVQSAPPAEPEVAGVPRPGPLNLGASVLFADGSQLITFGDRAYQNGDVAQAASCYAQAVRRNPANQRALLGLSKALVALGHFDQAYPHVQRAVQLDPRNLEAHQQLVIILEARGDSAGLAQTLDAILAIDADVVAARIMRGHLYAWQNDHGRAVGDWEQALRLLMKQPASDDREWRRADLWWLCATSYDQLGPGAAQAALDAYTAVVDSPFTSDPDRKGLARTRMTVLLNQLSQAEP